MDLGHIDPADVGSEKRRILLTALVFAAVAGLAALDLAQDAREGTTLRHAVIEGTIVVASFGAMVVSTHRFAKLRRRECEARSQATELAAALERSRAEGARWRAEAKDLLAGLGALIDQQFGRWGLTPAEKEVAWLLLKGLSHKKVATVRSVSVATARQQATAVYRKAGLGGRHDLAAFFLEDLLADRTGG